MSQQMPRYHNGNMGPQARWGNQQNQQAWFHPPPVHFFQGEIQRLNALLEMERARWFEENQKVAYLEAELEDTKFQWRRQKNLKEMFINKGKETKRELERIEKFTDPATLNPAAIASKVHNDMKYKKKKLLQKDFEELKVAHILDQEAFTSQIQAEKEKNNALQEELDKLKTSYEELRSKCEADVAAGRQQADMLKFGEVRMGEDPQLLENLRAEKEDLYQKMSQEITFLQEREKGLQRELDQIKVSYQELNCKYEKDVSAWKQQAETYQQEINRDKNANLERANKDLQPNNLRAEKDDLYQKMSQEIAFLQEKEKQWEIDLYQMKESYDELIYEYNRDVGELENDVQEYKKDLDREKKANSKRAKKDLELINKLRDENAHLQKTMLEEIEESEENHVPGEMDQNEKDSSALRQQVENVQLQIIQEKKAHLETTKKDQALLNSMRAEKDQLKKNMSKVIACMQEKENGFQKELDQIKVSYQELNYRYEKDVSALKQQTETCQQELNREKNANLERTNKDLQPNNLQAGKDDLYQKMSQEIAFLQEREKGLQRELDQIKVSHQELNCKYEKDVSAWKQQAETYRREINREKNANLERANKDLQPNNLRADKDDLYQKMSQEIAFLQEKEKELESELEQVKDLHQELLDAYERDVAELKQEAETYQKELDRQKKANSKRAKRDLRHINKLTYENTFLYNAMSEDIDILQENFKEPENHVPGEMDQNEKDNSALRQQVKNVRLQIIQEKKGHLETTKKDLALLNNLRAEQDQLKENMSKVIAFLQEKENGFQRELDQIKVSYQELNCKYEKDVSALKQQAETYQKDLDHEKKANSKRAKKDLQHINKLRDENAHLHKTMSEEIEILKQKSKEPENHLPGEMDQNEKDNSTLRQQVENVQLQIIQEKKAHLETTKKDLALLNRLRAEQDQLKENMSKEITFLQENEKSLEGEMDKIKVLYQELNSRYETDVSALKQQAEAFKQEINNEKKAHLETANKNLELINNIQAEKDDLQQKVTVLQQTSSDREICLKTELENLTTELQYQITTNTELSAELEDRDDLSKQKRKSVKFKEPSQQKESIHVKNISDPARMDLNCLSEETLSDISEFTNISNMDMDDIMENFKKFSTYLDSKLIEKTETMPEKLNIPDPEPMEKAGKETELTPSVWKKVRHALGLRKPEKWKKNKNTSNVTN